ncbi:V-type ATP synthase subunit A [Herbivorax sp. ANBcel31]|uniref:V-type ATP synthase subunit A n=1 Tax=Herbivorax sp. ANBcel31 TaxID=3069754 RepID=UPI0027B525FC|nr:V-type ATP synthase subunit A [Herbivorax sp. ANBcel31]MDQ2087263.1 V-type ATP synthase subunit A [Herbivorax sp. ANBcel31]
MESDNQKQGYIYSIDGPVIKAKGNVLFKMREVVLVGNEKLIGEVIELKNNLTIIQVHETTTGLTPGEPVVPTGKPLSLKLAPGIIGNVFDGIQRPLKTASEKFGLFIERGINLSALNDNFRWPVHITVKPGDTVTPGMVFAEVQETSLIMHKVMIPCHIEGKVSEVVADGYYTINDTLINVISKNKKTHQLPMVQEWSVRDTRPYNKRLLVGRPLVTGQRVIDSFFPMAKGGTAAIPGSFGTGKTMTQHQIAKWCDADIIFYIGCGERGNEMTEVLEEFPKLIDPRSGKSLMERTVLIANTSDMPVAAREASIYTGVTMAEYYRDMGYDVAIMVDSTSRWAEALREISGRLEEMPAEEGFPAYLSSRLSEFYGRAGININLNNTTGSISIIGAVSPQSGDFSEPVTQNTKRYIRCFWGLDRSLAYSRHYPAIDWLSSYSEYINSLASWYEENVSTSFVKCRNELLKILQEESGFKEIVKLVGGDILPDNQKLILEIGRVIRLSFLQQDTFHSVDTFVPLKKQYFMMDIMLFLYNKCLELLNNQLPISLIKETGLFEEVVKIKYTISNDELDKFVVLKKKIERELDRLLIDYTKE